MSFNGTALTVRGLSKAYTITHSSGRHTTLGEAFAHWLKNPLRRAPRETFWSLKNVSFDVRTGEILGVIGRNGAGKSTLLKILSSIVEPSAGEIHLYGSVGSLLEVGTGFHPELTGRENVYLNGALLGMSRREINRQFNTIVEFAEVGDFLDTPVKRYSSGMYVRLAFAIAAHLRSDILLLDEVLAVGDMDFRKRCLDKMNEVASSGRTVIFVSHNMATVQNICNRVIWISEGRIEADGDPEIVIAAYKESNQAVSPEDVRSKFSDSPLHLERVG
jgi:lipopolysaccharide transport system ATP-binding protein